MFPFENSTRASLIKNSNVFETKIESFGQNKTTVFFLIEDKFWKAGKQQTR